MDTLTHALVGAAISDCWFRKRLGPVATPFALAMAALPDIDVVAYFAAPEFAWAHHRGLTHSFFPMLVAAPVLGGAGYLLSRKHAAWTLWALLALLCLFSHTLIDLATSWGTMPFLPFSDARISWDIAPILDIFVFSVACGSFVANRVLRWERVETFLNPLRYPVVYEHPERRRAADWIGKIAVPLIVAYLLLGWHQNRQTVRRARLELARAGVEAVEVRALPIMFTYVAWDIAARDAEGTVYNAAHSSFAPLPMLFRRYPTLPSAEIAREMSTAEGGLFAWYSQGMFVAERREAENGSRVLLSDRRFFSLLDPDASRFVMEFDRDGSGAITGIRAVPSGLDGVDVRNELRRLWELTRYGRSDGAGDAVSANIPDGGR